MDFNKTLLLESMFKKEDWSKHNYKYIRGLLDNLINGHYTNVSVDGTLRPIRPNEFDVEKLKEIRSRIGIVNDDKLIAEFNDAINLPVKTKNRSKWTMFDKSPYSGVVGTSKEDSQELGCCFYLDQLLHHQKMNIDEYEDSGIIVNGSKYNIDTFKALIANDPSWDDSCKESAQSIIKILKSKPNININNIRIHYKDKLYNNIRVMGGKLSGIRPDKWNPADLMIIKKDFVLPPISHFSGINDYNEFINENVVSISLKKDAKATRGAVGIQEANRYLQINVPIKKYKDSLEAISDIRHSIEYLKNCPFNSKIRVVQSSSTSTIMKLLKGQVVDGEELANFKQTKIGIGVGNVLSFIVGLIEKNKGNNNILIDQLSTIYDYASSLLSVSCQYYMVAGNHYRAMGHDNSKEVKFKQIYIPLNDTASVNINITVDGEDIMLVGRCKKSGLSGFPDFNIKAGTYGSRKAAVPIAMFES